MPCHRGLVAAAVVAVMAGCTAPVDRDPSGPGARSDAGSASVATQTPEATPRATATERALAVTVADDGPAGSLAGLLEAHTVIEYPLTADRGTLVVISRSDADAIGPVRTATSSDVAVAAAFDADLVTGATTATAVDALGARGLAVVEEQSPPGALLRDPARRAPFNLYAMPRRVRDALAARCPEPAPDCTPSDAATDGGLGWTFGPPRATGDPVAEVAVSHAGDHPVAWTWDAGARRWLRTSGGRLEQQADGHRVAAATVVVAEVAAPPADVVAALRGAGPAVVLRDGRRHAARWQRDDAAAAPLVQRRDGSPFPLSDPVWLMLCATPCAQQIAPNRAPPQNRRRPLSGDVSGHRAAFGASLPAR